MKKSFLTRGFLFIFCVVVLTCLVYLFAVEAQAQNTNFVYSSSDTAFSYKFNSGIDLTKTIPGFVSEYGKATPRSIRLRNTSTDTLYLAFQTKSGAPDTSSTGVIKVAPGRVWKWGEIPSNKIYWKGRTTGSRIFYEVFWAPGSDMPGTEESGLSPEEANTFTAPQTFEDSTTMREVMMLGTAIQRPVMYFKYEDAAQPQTGFVGQVGVGEMNIGLNLDYQAGLHNYFDSTKPQMYQTFNPTEGQVLQWIPPGYPNVTSQPDAWNLSGNTYLYQFDTSGNAKFKGGIVSILKTKGQPNIEASRINDIFDTTRYNVYGRGAKSFLDWKLGVGIETPVGIVHIFNKATPKQTVTYNGLTDVTIEDAGVSDRAQLGFVSPNGSLIAMGDSATYNKAYLQYVNSTGILNIISSTSVNINGTTISASGTTTSTNTVIAPSFTSNAGGGFQATAGGIFYFTGRSVVKSPGDGTLTVTNNAETSFVNFKVGAGNFTAGFIRGVTDTDITAPYFRSPNGTLYYLLVNDAGVLSTSTTAP